MSQGPRLAEATQLLGEYPHSGYSEPSFLVRRSDGQVLQLSRLLYILIAAVDGEGDLDTLAERVSARAGRGVTRDGIAYLLDQKLRPLGLLESVDEEQQKLPRAKPLFALQARRRVISEQTVNRVAGVLHPLFWPAVVFAVLSGVLIVDYAVVIREGIGSSLHAVAMTPAYVLLVLALVVLSTFVHEWGHATGCRYSGGRPGGIGVGIYLLWPAFYTNVNDAYRLGRPGRVRTDLGGAYFSMLSVVAFGVAYAVTPSPALVVAIAAIQFQMAQQLLPIVRFDGYYVLSDLTGVPDLFSRVGPVLRSLVRRDGGDPRVRQLRPRVRLVVTVWVLVVVPLLGAALAMLLLHLPSYLSDSWQSLRAQVTGMETAIDSGDATAFMFRVVQVFAIAIPVAGSVLVLGRLGNRILASGHRVYQRSQLDERKRWRSPVRTTAMPALSHSPSPANGAGPNLGATPAASALSAGPSPRGRGLVVPIDMPPSPPPTMARASQGGRCFVVPVDTPVSRPPSVAGSRGGRGLVVPVDTPASSQPGVAPTWRRGRGLVVPVDSPAAVPGRPLLRSDAGQLTRAPTGSGPHR